MNRSVTCAEPRFLKILPEFETSFERQESIADKCVLRFPAIPFVPPEPYDVIRTDYKTYALVQGANDTSFVQIYSRTPNPGDEFLKARLETLKELGYPVEKIKRTPQVTIPVKLIFMLLWPRSFLSQAPSFNGIFFMNE